MHAALKPLQHPRFWLGMWWAAIIATIVVCLLPAPDLPDTPPGVDKIEHLLAYFMLAASAVQLWIGRRAMVRVAAGLVMLGILIEFAQGAFTTTRAMDPWDAVADAIGVLAGLAIALAPLRNLLLRFDRRR